MTLFLALMWTIMTLSTSNILAIQWKACKTKKKDLLDIDFEKLHQTRNKKNRSVANPTISNLV